MERSTVNIHDYARSSAYRDGLTMADHAFYTQPPLVSARLVRETLRAPSAVGTTSNYRLFL